VKVSKNWSVKIDPLLLPNQSQERNLLEDVTLENEMGRRTEGIQT
jgi:hypothetical protein